MSCEDPAGLVTFVAGDTWAINCVARYTNGNPFPLDTATSISVSFTTSAGLFIVKSLANSGIVLTSAIYGQFQILFTPIESAQMGAGILEFAPKVVDPYLGTKTIQGMKILVAAD